MRTGPSRDLAEELGPAHGGAVYGDLVGPGAQDRGRLVHRIDPTAHAEGDRERRGDAGGQIDRGPTSFRGSGDVQEDELVRALMVVPRGEPDGIAGIPQVDEPRALHHAAVLHVEAGDDPFGEHLRPPPRARNQ